jgi:hypothetical protein
MPTVCIAGSRRHERGHQKILDYQRRINRSRRAGEPGDDGNELDLFAVARWVVARFEAEVCGDQLAPLRDDCAGGGGAGFASNASFAMGAAPSFQGKR